MKYSKLPNNLNFKNRILIALPAAAFMFIFLAVQTACCFCFDSNYLKEKIESAGALTGTEYESAVSETVPEESTPLEIPELTVLSKLKVSGQAIDVKAFGGYAYLTNDLGILYVVDVRDKENPEIVGKCTGINSANIVIVQGNYAYVSYTDWIFPDDGEEAESGDLNADVYSVCGFKIIDIRDKRNPVVVGDYISGDKEKKSVQGMFIDGDYAYINATYYLQTSLQSQLEIIDIRNKENPRRIGDCDIEGQANSLYASGDYIYINNSYYDLIKNEYTGESRFFTVDIKNKNNPVVKGSCEVYSNSWSILVNENYAYLSSSIYDEKIDDYKDSMLQVIDIGEPENPLPIGDCTIPGGAWELDVKDDFLFISNNEGGVSVVNISDPKNPVIAAFLSTSGNSYDIALHGDYGYIADGFNGFVIVSVQKKSPGEGMIVEEGEDGIAINKEPVADIEIFGDKLNNNTYPEDNSIFFSAINSYDPEGQDLKYGWKVNGREIIENTDAGFSNFSSAANVSGAAVSEKEDKLKIIFSEPGVHEVTLEVSDGEKTDLKSRKVIIDAAKEVVTPLKEHTFDVEIECVLENKSDIELKNLKCYLRLPQTFSPFQVVNSIKGPVKNSDEVFDDCWNMLAHLEFDKDLTVPKKGIFNTVISANVTMQEYSFEELKTNGTGYNDNDEDLINYTGEDLFIDTDSPILINAVSKTIGSETDPVIIARKLYDFVTENLYYDFPRAADRDYEFMSASEILNTGKGVCADYAILYVTLLRIAKIPSRVIGGIPVSLMLSQKNKEIDVGHAWVELKLPGYGWIPVDITQEDGFMRADHFLNLATEKGTSFLYESQTMDWTSYYYDGFKYDWEGQDSPNVEQKLIYRIKNLDLGDLQFFR